MLKTWEIVGGLGENAMSRDSFFEIGRLSIAFFVRFISLNDTIFRSMRSNAKSKKKKRTDLTHWKN